MNLKKFVFIQNNVRDKLLLQISDYKFDLKSFLCDYHSYSLHLLVKSIYLLT